MKCTSLIIYLEGVTVPLLWNDWEEREYALQNLHPGKSLVQWQASCPACDMQSLVSFVVVIIQVETGMQKELVSPFPLLRCPGGGKVGGCAGKVEDSSTVIVS